MKATKNAYVILGGLVAAVLLLFVNATPAFAYTHTYPTTNDYQGGYKVLETTKDKGSWVVGSGQAKMYAYSEPVTGQGAGQTAVYIYSSLYLYQGTVITLSNISANIKGALATASGTGNIANVGVQAYVGDTVQGALGGRTTSLYYKQVSNGGSYFVSPSSPITAPSIQYTIPTSGTYYIVGYIQINTYGSDGNAIANFYDSPYGLTNFTITETH
jgi:hypothetical protein